MICHVPTDDSSQTCRHCGTIYQIPEGRITAEEHTCDVEPPHTSVVYHLAPGERLPNFNARPLPIIHECHRGVECTEETHRTHMCTWSERQKI